MPFEIMDQRGLSASPHLFGEICYHPERKIESPKPKSSLDQQDEIAALDGRMMDASPLEIDAHTGSQQLQPNEPQNVVQKIASECHGLVGDRILVNAASRESSLFSSSMSEIFNRKLRLLGTDIHSHGSNNAVASPCEEEPGESFEQIRDEAIGSLLPDEDDLLSGVIDDIGGSVHAGSGNDFEDFDLFSSGGGMELEGDDHLNSGKLNYDIGAISGCDGVSNGRHLSVEQPSRTLFVRNISINVEDSELKPIFEQYGEVQTLYTACKLRGFVMISYFDLRAAQTAMRSLKNLPLRHKKLNIHYSIPKENSPENDFNHGMVVCYHDSSVSNDDLRQIFGLYGEIKDIYEAQEKHLKVIEFYDVRAAEAAFHALNRTDMVGKQIKVAPGNLGCVRRLMPQFQKDLCAPDLCQGLHNNILLGLKGNMLSGAVATRCLGSGSNQEFHSAVQQPRDLILKDSFLPGSGSNQEFHSAAQQPRDLILKDSFLPVNPSITNTTGKLFGAAKSNNVVDGMKFSCIPSFHPHSFPEYHDNFANGVPCNYSSSIADVAHCVRPAISESIDSSHLGMNPSGSQLEFKGGGIGSPGSRSFPNNGIHHMWKNSNMHQQHPSSPIMWQNSPPYVNAGCAPCLPQMPGLSRTPPHMLRASHLEHHVGSAPTVNASPWDRRHAYLGESPEPLSFRLGSLGNSPGTWQLHPADISSQKMFSHVGGRNSMMSISNFESTNERARNLYHRRSEANSNNADKKQYELDIDRILHGEDNRTTLMIKNIPNKYTSKMLLAAIDEHCRGTYDFIYLPIDFKNKCNVGYAFINMIDACHIIPFYQAFNGKRWEKFNSEKVASLAYARIQGKAALIAHFQNSSLMNEDKRCRPILFHTDGPNAGDPEPFPMGTNIRSRPGKSRISGIEENRSQVSPSIFASGGECNTRTDSALGFLK